MPPPSADSRVRRLLALVPWVVEHDGPRLADVCARFGITEEELAADLELLWLCGLPPYSPDVLIDVDISDGRVWIRYADYFGRPLRLTPAEALALLAAGKTLLATPGTDPAGPLARGLDKLASALGIDAGAAVDIALGPAPGELLDALRAAAADHRQVELDYYSYGSDQDRRRVVDPYAVFSAKGQWYLSAWCHAVDDERLFRVDRIRSARMLDTSFDPPGVVPDLAVFEPGPDDPRVTLELEPGARWVAEQYPAEKVEQLSGGRARVVLVASRPAWLERLLLRLGPDARVVDGDATAGRAAAARLLERYRA
ncbi:MAG: putative DNA-binding protein [Acidimicrobiales bacterium]|nr:putative DNA-binding protein [Acidimicrobiales bacterium]